MSTTCSDPTTTATATSAPATSAPATGASSAAGPAHPGPGSAGGDEFTVVQLAACDAVGRADRAGAGVPGHGGGAVELVPAPPGRSGAPRPAPTPHTERVQPRALSPAERARVRELLNTTYLDQAPATAWAETAGRQAQYHCSISTMYRILREHGEVTERRRQATHPPRVKPELMAASTEPGVDLGRDETRRSGAGCLVLPVRDHRHLQPLLPRAGMIAHTEDGELARRFLRESITKHRIDPDTLTLHADRGGPQKCKFRRRAALGPARHPVALRPKTSNDNPYSEAQFKTLKYRLGLPRPPKPRGPANPPTGRRRRPPGRRHWRRR